MFRCRTLENGKIEEKMRHDRPDDLNLKGPTERIYSSSTEKIEMSSNTFLCQILFNPANFIE